jgi:hypothetical protein
MAGAQAPSTPKVAILKNSSSATIGQVTPTDRRCG